MVQVNQETTIDGASDTINCWCYQWQSIVDGMSKMGWCESWTMNVTLKIQSYSNKLRFNFTYTRNAISNFFYLLANNFLKTGFPVFVTCSASPPWDVGENKTNTGQSHLFSTDTNIHLKLIDMFVREGEREPGDRLSTATDWTIYSSEWYLYIKWVKESCPYTHTLTWQCASML